MMNRNPSKSTSRTIVFSLFLFFTFSVILAMIVIFFQAQVNITKKAELIKNEKNVVALEGQTINKNLNSLYTDVLYLAYTFQNNHETTDDGGYEQLIDNWKAFSDSKKIYFKIRYIDKNGSEKIRINYSDNGSYTTANEGLENKIDRYYFQNTIELSKSQIYISKLDLDIENGKIDLPIRPTIRISTTVYNKTGELKGVIVLSYNAKYLISDFANLSSTSSGNVFLINSDGYWLYNSTNRDKEWTFMYEDKKDVRFSTEHPNEWMELSNSKEGSITGVDGLFTYSKIVPYIGYFDNVGGKENNTIIPGEGEWLIVSEITSESKNNVVFDDNLYKIALLSFAQQKLIFLIILIFSAVTTILVALNRASKENLRYFTFDALTGCYNRRSGFEQLQKVYQRISKKKGQMSICFLDVNGLKGINDTFGHVIGDEIIISVTDAIKECIRDLDFIVRIGGDEFLIVLVNKNLEQAENIWQKISQKYEHINQSSKKLFKISVSHGIEEFSFDTNEIIGNVVNLADEKMYNEKRKIYGD